MKQFLEQAEMPIDIYWGCSHTEGCWECPHSPLPFEVYKVDSCKTAQKLDLFEKILSYIKENQSCLLTTLFFYIIIKYNY